MLVGAAGRKHAGIVRIDTERVLPREPSVGCGVLNKAFKPEGFQVGGRAELNRYFRRLHQGYL
jgi:hypothetical protein